ncbi:MAG: hypothetical protein ACI9FN_002647 [Saprospiraceae bacterium]|jgi:hypothetical protein
MKYSTLLFILMLICSCGDDDNMMNPPQNSNPDPDEWLIPQNEFRDGGPGLDGIPSIDQSNFTIAREVDFLDLEELVLGIRVGNVIKAYPHSILDWHEIVNDRIGNEHIALTYCPLTGTGVGWDRMVNQTETTFGVSGLLYNSNLMPYDRATGSIWSQQLLKSVNGTLIGNRIELHSFVEMSWESWLGAYPVSEVMNRETGFDRDYNRYPYGDYRTNDNNIIFPVNATDNRLNAKDRVLGVIINENVKAYPFNTENPDIELIEDEYLNQELLVVRNATRNYIVAFLKPEGGRNYEALSENAFPNIIQDSNGTLYDLMGRSSNNSGQELKLADQFIGYWFSWGTFYPGLELYGT